MRSSRSILSRLGGCIAGLVRETRGNVVVIFALVLPTLAVCSAGAVEIADVVRVKAMLQAFVDSAALTGAKQFAVDHSSSTTERARLMADAEANAFRPLWTVQTAAKSDLAAGSVTVSQDALRPSFFGNLLPPGGFRLAVTATATINASRTPLCVLGLRSSAKQVVMAQSSATITATDCLVQSDSDVAVLDGARISAGAVRAVSSATGNISPRPLTDAPAIPDPFASLSIKVPGTCDDKDFQANKTISTLSPGVHCGTIKIAGSSRLILKPGEHYFLNAQLDFVGSAQLTGTDVVLVFSGTTAAQFKGQAFMSLEGRQSGPYAGFVLVTDRSFTDAVEISTTSAHKLLGTIYLPNASLAVSGNGNKVADHSPWTVVVANQISVDGSAELVINSNYTASSVPVPSGVGNIGSVRLMQ